ncbi:MAG: SRPBCC domain-containing protein [Elusimicrobiota bacterium]
MKGRDIDIQVLIDNKVDKVYEAWIKPDMLERWLTRKAHVEAAVGGAYELFWNEENPAVDSTLGCKITELVVNAELSFNWKGIEAYAELMGKKTSVFVRFEPREGATLLRFIHTGWGSGLEWEKARLWQAEAWREAIENLKNMLENTDRFLENISMN